MLAGAPEDYAAYVAAVRAALAHGCGTLIEVGPHPVLTAGIGAVAEAAGHDTAVFALRPSTGARGMDELAADLGRFVNERFAGRRLAIVGFSMGGIVARYWVQRLGGLARTERLIALATPHRGTATARLFPLPGIRQLRRGSPFLEDLNGDREVLLACGVASIWSPIDLMVVPPGSGRLGIGFERRLLIPIHAWIPRSRRVIREVLRLLDGPRATASSSGQIG